MHILMTVGRLAAMVLLSASLSPAIAGQRPASSTPPSARPDPWTARPRVVVLTDIANEPDDQMSLVRFLVYANQFDVEGLIATTSTWLKEGPRRDVIEAVLGAYGEVQPSLARHADGFPTAEALRAVTSAGQAGYGMAAVGRGKATPGSDRLRAALQRDDSRPIWVLCWGGANTLAQALVDARATLDAPEFAALVARVRVYAISDQDDAGPWLRREFPDLMYVASPSTQDGQEYASATWTGISGDLFYRNAPGADFSTFSDAWVNAHIRTRGPLGRFYPYPCCIHEGDTPAFLGLIDNGLASAMSPSYGGWGGRYVFRQPSGEARAFWTQGGDSYPGRDDSRDTVVGHDGHTYVSDQATIWRWRRAFQHDFAARMAWTVSAPDAANHAPVVVVNGDSSSGPLRVEGRVGVPLDLDAAGTRDPDGDRLTYRWWFYAEAGTGVPGMPVATGRPVAPEAPPEGASPPAALGRRPAPRVRIDDADAVRARVTPVVPGLAHVILEVTDAGSPALTRYRRIILESRQGEEVGRGVPPRR